MAQLKDVWLDLIGQAVRIDWDNNRHQRIALPDRSPASVAAAFKKAAELIKYEHQRGEI